MDTQMLYYFVTFYVGVGIAVGGTLMGLIWVYSSHWLDRRMITIADLYGEENEKLRKENEYLRKYNEKLLEQTTHPMVYTEPAGEIIQSQAKVQGLKEAGKISIGDIIQD